MELHGDGNFKLENVKQMKITKDFRALDEQSRKCQTKISFEDCVTKKYLESMKANCKCLPYNLQNYSLGEKVNATVCSILLCKHFFKFYALQIQLCDINGIDSACVEKIELPYSKCLKPCEGIYADFKKSPVQIVQKAKYQLLMDEYLKYTWFQDTKDIGKDNFYEVMQHNTTLKFVRIYFDTTTFDRITKDSAAKFVDMLSAIGGTMGLLTGFSIISAVEIVYFATKWIFQFYFVIKK